MNLQTIVVGITALMIGILGGFVVGQGKKSSVQTSQVVVPKQQVAKPDTVKEIQSSTLFENQTASFEGVITKVEENIATVKNKAGKESKFPIADEISIYKFAKPNEGTRLSDKKDIELNKDVVLVLVFKNTQYEIVSLTYNPPTVPQEPFSPLSTSSPTSKP
ncbi:MAG: hypothetical protein A3F31_01650 [Candidatus Levybacteria bacterium RIFCSPHIGHO2_12_FULL_38_12]|nr:MAG: hypothetical protein A2770_02610 [Candidatus Levybacteria bacterium RIFCSPHIGHO2_01_FULL_38_12]OGH22073.1 MAG: hypothetical protein A3D75_01575 [Candidatus Levybacteria bacterium RIFCSPHIGHO2_02_FULL_37_18]OGH22911.1 MAG: hypothetical protein A3F31_01650 [Candidatus Levybacteria bacterium RIFCSPHIGHO2_12_FULL_38_12]OGH34045.1 MAG: hypothetical protein A3A47_00180 [Candidatus Levybacteria bacterium RIFCSPLOWO2_01_FULL_37_20]OGH44905.1 MAG: hypothetical protein A3J14_02690 [Candidatus Lev